MSNEVMLARQVAFYEGILRVCLSLFFTQDYGNFLFGFKILLSQIFSYFSRVYENEIQHSGSGIAFDDIDEVLNSKPVRLPVFSHDIANVYNLCFAFLESFFHSNSQEVRYDACIQITGADDNVIRVNDGFARSGIESSATHEICFFYSE